MRQKLLILKPLPLVNLLFAAGLALVVLGVLLIAAVPFIAMAYHAEVNTAAVGCVVVLFFPICFGAGTPPALTWGLTAVAALLFVLALAQWLLWKKYHKEEEKA